MVLLNPVSISNLFLINIVNCRNLFIRVKRVKMINNSNKMMMKVYHLLRIDLIKCKMKLHYKKSLINNNKKLIIFPQVLLKEKLMLNKEILLWQMKLPNNRLQKQMLLKQHEIHRIQVQLKMLKPQKTYKLMKVPKQLNESIYDYDLMI